MIQLLAFYFFSLSYVLKINLSLLTYSFNFSFSFLWSILWFSATPKYIYAFNGLLLLLLLPSSSVVVVIVVVVVVVTVLAVVVVNFLWKSSQIRSTKCLKVRYSERYHRHLPWNMGALKYNIETFQTFLPTPGLIRVQCSLTTRTKYDWCAATT
jgi:hypothetical protein